MVKNLKGKYLVMEHSIFKDGMKILTDLSCDHREQAIYANCSIHDPSDKIQTNTYDTVELAIDITEMEKIYNWLGDRIKRAKAYEKKHPKKYNVEVIEQK